MARTLMISHEMTWSNDRRITKVRARTYYASILFAVFSVTVLLAAFNAPDMPWFLALFACGSSVVAISCYLTLRSALSSQATREDAGSTCATSTAHRVGACPDSHLSSNGKCVLRDDPLFTSNKSYRLDESVDSPIATNEDVYRTLVDVDGLDSAALKELCEKFGRHPFTALLRMDETCARTAGL